MKLYFGFGVFKVTGYLMRIFPVIMMIESDHDDRKSTSGHDFLFRGEVGFYGQAKGNLVYPNI